MAKYDSTFFRYEKKYLLTNEQYHKFMQMIKPYVKDDKYGKTTILNIYFDTDNYRLIRTSIQKPIFKEKLRLRSYGIPSEDDNVFIEIKRKFNKLVYKRRTIASYKDALAYLSGQKKLDDSNQICREINYFLSYYKDLKPAMFISYDRTSFRGIEDKALRITLDSNITFRTDDLSLSHGIYGQKILKNGEYLLEIKTPSAIPLWLCKILNDLLIYPTSFSKYGKAYISTLSESTNNKGGKLSA